MANFVLVHGAWHGAWCWRAVVQQLGVLGHRVHAVTLTGVGDRAHLMSRDITLETHIADVLNVIEVEELGDVVLATHSCAGMIGTAIADRMPQRLRHLVYLDAVIPKPGASWSSTHAEVTASVGNSFPPPDPAVFGLQGDQSEWVDRRQTPHPAQTYQATLDFDPHRVASVARTFVNCTKPSLGTLDAMRLRVRDPSFWGGVWMNGASTARVADLTTGHDPMISAPEQLVQVLLDCQ